MGSLNCFDYSNQDISHFLLILVGSLVLAAYSILCLKYPKVEYQDKMNKEVKQSTIYLWEFDKDDCMEFDACKTSFFRREADQLLYEEIKTEQ